MADTVPPLIAVSHWVRRTDCDGKSLSCYGREILRQCWTPRRRDPPWRERAVEAHGADGAGGTAAGGAAEATGLAKVPCWIIVRGSFGGGSGRPAGST